MKTNSKSLVTTFIIGMALMVTSCGTTQDATQPLGNNIDSIQVEVSKPMTSYAILLDQGRKAIVTHNGQVERALTAKETGKLKSLAKKLFVKKSDPIILSEEKGYGRTSQPIFRVTIYNKGKGETTRYDMGDEDNGVTQATTKRIRYTEAFREFMFNVFNIIR